MEEATDRLVVIVLAPHKKGLFAMERGGQRAWGGLFGLWDG